MTRKEKRMSEKSNKKFVFGAMIGAAAGALAGVLFAPKSGKETRKVIADKAGEIAEKSKDLAKKGEELARKEGHEIKELTEKVTDKLKK